VERGSRAVRPMCWGRCCTRPPTHSRTSARSRTRPGRALAQRAVKALAEEVGIEVTKDARIGWSPTTIPARTRDAYADVIGKLRRAPRLHGSVETTDGGRTKKPTPPCVCACGQRIGVAPSVRAAGPITCGACGTDFELDPATQVGSEAPEGAV
jgi:hypothetical protein